MKRTEPKLIRDIFEEALRLDSSARLLQQRACYKWAEIMGFGINRYTARRHIDADGVMTVELTSAPLKHELSMRLPQIVEMLNNAVGKDVVKKIILI